MSKKLYTWFMNGPLMSNVYHRIFYENVSAKCIVKHFELRIITDMGTPIKTHLKYAFIKKFIIYIQSLQNFVKMRY